MPAIPTTPGTSSIAALTPIDDVGLGRVDRLLASGSPRPGRAAVRHWALSGAKAAATSSTSRGPGGHLVGRGCRLGPGDEHLHRRHDAARAHRRRAAAAAPRRRGRRWPATVWACPILMPKIGMMSARAGCSATPAAIQRRRTTGGPRRSTRGRPLLVPDPRQVDPRPDAAEHGRQQGQADQRADQRDEHAADTHAAQQRHRDHQQRAQADGHRAGAGNDRVTGVLHRDDDGVVVVPAVRPFLAPSVDDEQRVVDRDAEADQRDQELHHEADVHRCRWRAARS